jgi:long-chain acyl-CoA synthetase
MLEITGGLMAPLYAGSCVTYCDTLKTGALLPLMREVRTTAMIGVPLVLKMIRAGILKKAAKLPMLKQKIFQALLSISKSLLKLNIRIGRLLFPSIHEEFGGKLRTFISGGAPLDIDVEMDLNAMGFRVLQGYGLTETSPVVSVNTFEDNRFGSVGKPLPGVEVRILKNNDTDTEGEILVRGPGVMKGYFGSPEKTAEAIKDGWLHTGDLGYIDKDGFLYISGRKKNLIVLGGGKKVFPEEVEEAIGKSSYIKEICVLPKTAKQGIRKGHEEVYAVIVPNTELFEQDGIIEKSIIYKKIASEINRLGKCLSPHKRIMGFEVSYEELPKTVTKKVRRDVVSRTIRR